jgi:hypothetical protein
LEFGQQMKQITRNDIRRSVGIFDKKIRPPARIKRRVNTNHERTHHMNHDHNGNFGPDINPATGLPLIDDAYIDVCGNPYGTNTQTWQPSYDPGPNNFPSQSIINPW